MCECENQCENERTGTKKREARLYSTAQRILETTFENNMLHSAGLMQLDQERFQRAHCVAQ